MSMEVDTREVRRVAEEVRNIAANVRELSEGSLAGMRANVRDDMEGKTADALADVLEALSGDIKRIASGLSDVQRALIDYAERVEEADRKAKETIEAN